MTIKKRSSLHKCIDKNSKASIHKRETVKISTNRKPINRRAIAAWLSFARAAGGPEAKDDQVRADEIL